MNISTQLNQPKGFWYAFLLLIPFASFAQETYPLTRFVGQIFEQGYGQTGDEEGIDLIQFQDNTIMCGWNYYDPELEITEETDLTDYSAFDLNATFWRMDPIGDQLWEVSIPLSGEDEIATGICKGNTEEEFAVCIRQTAVYDPNSVVSFGDELFVWTIDISGNYTLLYHHQSGEDILGMAPIDIKKIDDGYLILANAFLNTGRKEVRLLRIDLLGNFVWQQAYGGEGDFISYEMVIDHNDNAVFAVNNLTNNTVSLVGFAQNSDLAFDARGQGDNLRLFGIDEDHNPEILVAGYHINEGGQTDAVVARFDATHLLSQLYIQGRPDGSESFRDLSVHDLGFQAVGLRDNEGEGQQSIYVSHMDNAGVEYYTEMMGSPENDRVTSLLLRNDAPLTAFAGRHTGYGIYETGNAYLGGVLLQKPQFTCTLPRAMFVDGYVGGFWDGVNQQWVVDQASSIITDPNNQAANAKETALLDYCKDEKITHLALYGINLLFDGTATNISPAQKRAYRESLNRFIVRAKNQNPSVTVGLIFKPVNNNLIGSIDYNQACANVQQNNFQQAGKINFIISENEYWNSTKAASLYLSDYNQFINDLDNVNTSKVNGANTWEAYAYIAKFGTNRVSLTHTYFNSPQNWSNLLPLAEDMDEVVDGFFLYTAPQHRFGPTNFLNDNITSLTPNPIPVTAGQTGHNRLTLSLLGNNSGRPTNVFPILYAQYNDYQSGGNTILGCPSGDPNVDPEAHGNHNLGPWLETYPPAVATNPNPNQGNDFTLAETIYIDQFDLILQAFNANPTNPEIPAQPGEVAIPIPNFDNIKIVGTSWWKYSCLGDKGSFASPNANARISCSHNTSVLSPVSVPEQKTLFKTEISIFPNPFSNGLLSIESTEDQSILVDIYDVMGRNICHEKKNLKQNQVQSIQKFNRPAPGAYFIHIRNKTGDPISIQKIIVR